MLGLLLPIFITIYVYKQAKENGRNPILWSIINIAVIFGTQILIGLAIGIGIALGIGFLGWSEDTFEKWTLLINLGAVVASLGASYLVVRYVTRVPDEQFNQAPPPPPRFN